MSRSIAAIIVLILLLSASAAFVASSSPDGLERVAEDLGFAEHETTYFSAPMEDYAMPRVPGGLSGVLAGVLGTVLVGGATFALGKLLSRRKANS
ncbi:MAG: cobalamin biosynthesis protein CbiN [Proteobacteria bacterium]|jgi:hypothetical protein|nr:cobalamin biosynthesis protein CbiN [Pseudomonadota bacterium]